MLLRGTTRRSRWAPEELRLAVRLAGLFALTALAPLSAQMLALDGVVADEKGKPLAGATVELTPLLPEAEVARLLLAGHDGPPPTASARTDTAGRYRLAAPKAGMWIVVASAPGRVAMQRELVPLLEATSLGEARLPPAVEVLVRVTDREGRPLAGAFVQSAPKLQPVWFLRWESLQEGWSRPGTRSSTAADGTLTLRRSRDDRLDLLAAAPGFPQAKGEEGASGKVEIRLEPGCRRTVAALDGGGRPLPGVVIAVGDSPAALTGPEGTAEAAFPCRERSTLRWIAPDGRHGVEPVPPGAGSAGGGSAPQRLTFTVRPAAYAGQVLEQASRRPIAGAYVWAEDDPGAAVRSDGEGRYLLPAPPPPVRRLAGASERAGRGWVDLPALPGVATAGSGRIAAPPLFLRSSALLRGTVVDEAGRPVDGARVESTPDPADARSENGADWIPVEQRTGEDGTFRLRVPAGLPLLLAARHPRRNPARLLLPPLQGGGQKTGIRLELPPGRAAFGRVVDLGEKPVAGANVRLLPASGEKAAPFAFYQDLRDEGFEGTTGADGRFAIAKVPGAALDLEVKASGYAPLLVPGIEPPSLREENPAPGGAKGASGQGGPVDLGTVVLRPGATLRGIVQDPRGRPVPDAAIRWSGPGGDRLRALRMRLGREVPSLSSGADGRFAISDLASGAPLNLSVTREGYGEARLTGVVPGADPAEPPVEVVLEPAFAVRGTVLDEAGRPIAEASVALVTTQAGWMQGGRLFRRPSRGQVTTDSEGRFELTAIETGKMRVEAQGQGFRRNGVDVEAAELKDVEGIEIVLRPGATLSGRVAGPDGEAVQGARVTLSGDAEDSPFRLSDNTALSDGDGEYTLSGLEEGRREVSVFAAGFLAADKGIEIQDGANRADLRLERALSVEGRVLDPQGRPAAGAQVSATFKDGSIGTSSREDGTFVLSGLRPGSYQIAADDSRYGPSEPVPVELGSAAAPVGGGKPGAPAARGIELRLTEGGAVRGRVAGLTFEQLPGVSVVASRADEDGDPRFFEARDASLDYQGEYRIAGLEPGEWRIAARLRSRSAEGRVTVRAGGESRLDLEFPAGESVSGRVTRAGAPLPRASVVLQPLAGRASGFAQTDSRGAFRIEGLEAGPYRLEILAFGSALHHRREVELPAAGEIVVDLTGSPVRGRVVDAGSRAPIARVVVGLRRDEDGDGGRGLPQVGAETDDAGNFLFEDVSPGKLTLTASREGYTRAERPLELSDEGVDGVVVELQSTEGQKVRVVAALGAELTGPVTVALVDPEAGTIRTMTRARLDETGRAPLDALPGSWELLVHAPGFAVSLQPVAFPGPEPVALLSPATFLRIHAPSLSALEAGGEVEVRDAGGRRFRGLGFDGGLRSSFPLQQGWANVPNLPAGTWLLTLKTPDGATLSGRATTALGSDNLVTLGGEGREAPRP